MKKLFLSSLFCLFSICIFSQSKIGHVNSQEIMSNMPDIKVIEGKIQAESKKMDANYATMAQEAQKAAQEFTEAQNTKGISDSELQAKYKAALDLDQRTQEYVQNAQRELQTLQNNLLAPIVEKVQNAINEVAKNGKFSYILDTGSQFNVVLYNEGPNSHDITADVKKKLNLK